MASYPSLSLGEPMAEMNTTPLIDVMLVLLIMFIMSVPLASHTLEFDLPSSPDKPHLGPILASNRITLSPEGTIAWNGVTQSEADLVATLKAAGKQTPEPLVLFQPDGSAPYGKSARVLRIIKASGLTAFGFVGNEQYGNFAKAAATR